MTSRDSEFLGPLGHLLFWHLLKEGTSSAQALPLRSQVPCALLPSAHLLLPADCSLPLQPPVPAGLKQLD